jgi:hypothetical protein
VALLFGGVILTGVASAEDYGGIIIKTDDDWYERGEIIEYNVTTSPGTKVHIIISDNIGSIVKEDIGIADENGTYVGWINTQKLWVGVWYFDVDDVYNNTDRTKISLKMNSQDIQELWWSINYWWRDFQTFIWQLIFNFFFVVGLFFVVFMIRESIKRAETTGEKTFWDSTVTHVNDIFKSGWDSVGLSKKGRRDSLMMARKRFNDVKNVVDENQEEINELLFRLKEFEKLGFDFYHGKPNEKTKKRLVKRWTKRIEKLEDQNERFRVLMDEGQTNLKKVLRRKGILTPNMGPETEQAILYAGEERDMVNPLG